MGDTQEGSDFDDQSNDGSLDSLSNFPHVDVYERPVEERFDAFDERTPVQTSDRYYLRRSGDIEIRIESKNSLQTYSVSREFLLDSRLWTSSGIDDNAFPLKLKALFDVRKDSVILDSFDPDAFEFMLRWVCASRLPNPLHLVKESSYEAEDSMTSNEDHTELRHKAGSHEQSPGSSSAHERNPSSIRFLNIFAQPQYEALSSEELRFAETVSNNEMNRISAIRLKHSNYDDYDAIFPNSEVEFEAQPGMGPRTLAVPIPVQSELYRMLRRTMSHRVKQLKTLIDRRALGVTSPSVSKKSVQEQRQITLLKVMAQAYRYQWEPLYNDAMDQYRAEERRIKRAGSASLVPHLEAVWSSSSYGSPLRNFLAEYASFMNMNWQELPESQDYDRKDFKVMLATIEKEVRINKQSPIMEHRRPYHFHVKDSQKEAQDPNRGLLLSLKRYLCPPRCAERQRFQRLISTERGPQ